MSDQTAEEQKERKARESSAYPKRSLIDALQLATALKEHNAGNPYDRLDLAKAVNRSPGSSEFRMLITSSGQFGLTEGGYVAKTISLTSLGRSIVYPQSADERSQGLKTALFNIPFFKKFFEDYDKNKLPSIEYLEGTLNRTYGIPVTDSKNCYSLIVKNGEELGVIYEQSGSKWINLNKLGQQTTKEEVHNPPPTPRVTTMQAPLPQIEVPALGTSNGVNVTVNIRFELPITTEIDVYDKIFESLKKHLLTPNTKAN